MVTGYERLIPKLDLPDADDRHVLAAAITGHCDVIITKNLQDFPKAAVKRLGIGVQHPDEFLSNHLSLTPGVFCEAVRKVRTRLKAPPLSVEDYLVNLSEQGLVATVGELEQFAALL